MITCGTQVVAGNSGGGATLPATPADALLDAASPSTMLGLNGSGVGEALSASAARSRIQVVPSDATPLVESGAGSAGTSANYSRADHVHPAAGATAEWLSLYDTPGLYVGGDAAFGWAQADRVSASAGAAVPAFGPGQSMVICLFPGATPSGQELIACHVSTAGTRGWYLGVGNNSGARRRLSLYFAGLNGSADLYLTGSDFTVGSAHVIAVTVLADKSVRYSVNGGAVQTIAALSGSYTAPTSSDTLRVGSTTDFAPSYYPPTSVLVGAARWYSTELSDADLVAACAGVATGTIPAVGTGTISAAFDASAFAGGVRVVAASPTPTWICAGNPSIHPV
jgi:hypothetical protein